MGEAWEAEYSKNIPRAARGSFVLVDAALLQCVVRFIYKQSNFSPCCTRRLYASECSAIAECCMMNSFTNSLIFLRAARGSKTACQCSVIAVCCMMNSFPIVLHAARRGFMLLDAALLQCVYIEFIYEQSNFSPRCVRRLYAS